MTPNNNLNVLAFYDSVLDQNHRRSFAYGNVYPLVCPTDKLLPFVLRRETSVDPISVCNLINLKTGASTDILAAALGNGLAVVVYDQFDLIVNYSNASGLTMAEGQFYLEISDGTNTWFSDVFNVVADLTNFIKIEYWDNQDFQTPDSVIPYGTEFKNWFYVKSEIGKPEYPFSEELEERDGRKYFEKQISEKRFRFEFLAPEFLCDAVRIVRMADNCLITSAGKVYGPEEILFTPEFQEQGDLAVVNVEFETSFVVKKLAGGGYESESGNVPPEIETILGFVRYDAAQFLTEEQKQQARDNIGIGETGGGLPDGIIDGFRVFYTNNAFEVTVGPGRIREGGVIYNIPQGNNINVGPSDPTNDRINVLKVSITAPFYGVELGTPDPNPSEPTDLGVGFYKITFFIIPGGSTELPGVTNEIVYKENEPGEYGNSFAGSGSYDPEYPTNPFEGLVSLQMLLIQSNSRVIFTKPGGGTINLQNFTVIGLQVYLYAQMNNGHFLQMDLISPSGFSVCGGYFNLPVQKSTFSQWQFVGIEIEQLNLSATIIDEIRIRFFRQSGPATYPGLQLDNIILQGGVEQPGGGTQNEDIVFPIVERGRSKGVKWEGVTDKFSIYVEEGASVPGGAGFYEKCNWVFEFSDNDNSIPEIEDEITFRFRAVDGITVVDVLKIKSGEVNALLQLKEAGKRVLLPPVASSGSVIYFDKQRTYGSKAAPITFDTLTISNTGPGGTETPEQFVQVIFHQAASLTINDLYIEEDENSADYDPARVAIIYIEWFSATYRRFIITYDKP